MHTNQIFHIIVNLLTFSLGGLSLIVPSGYSIGYIGFSIVGIFLFFKAKNNLDNKDYLIIIPFYLFALGILFFTWLHSDRLSQFDSPSRMLLAFPFLFALKNISLSKKILYRGLALGNIIALIWVCIQFFILEDSHISGHTHKIQFANIALMFATFLAFSLSSEDIRKPFEKNLLIIGSFSGFAISLLTGARGGWVALPFILSLYLWSFKKRIKKRPLLISFITALLISSGLYLIPGLKIQARIHAIQDDISLYQQGITETSLGARFEMWKGALILIEESPYLGNGAKGFHEKMRNLASKDIIRSSVNEYSHPHNDILNILAKYGIGGLILLLSLYLTPFFLFVQKIKKNKTIFPFLGALISLSYIVFGFSQSFLAHNSGIIVYTTWISIFWSLSHNTKEVPI